MEFFETLKSSFQFSKNNGLPVARAPKRYSERYLVMSVVVNPTSMSHSQLEALAKLATLETCMSLKPDRSLLFHLITAN